MGTPDLSIELSENAAARRARAALAERFDRARVVGYSVARLRDVRVSFDDGRLGVAVVTRLARPVAWLQRSTIACELGHFRIRGGVLVATVTRPLGVDFLPGRIAAWKLPPWAADILQSLRTEGAVVTVSPDDLVRWTGDARAERAATEFELHAIDVSGGRLRVELLERAQ